MRKCSEGPIFCLASGRIFLVDLAENFFEINWQHCFPAKARTKLSVSGEGKDLSCISIY
jgi:hypothetical protein